MKVINGIKLGGLQHKIFNLMLIFILALVGVYVAISAWEQRNLSGIVEVSAARQQASITEVSEETMLAVLNTTMTQSTGLQAYISDDLFSEVRTDVLTLQTIATELFAHEDQFSAHPFLPPSADNDGIPSVQMIHELGVNPDTSRSLALVANMSEVMLAMYKNSDKISGIFVGTNDGTLLYVNDRSGSYVSEDGTPMTLGVRSRPWYTQAAATGDLIFTGVETDAYTDNVTVTCAAPIYQDGRLAGVVGADIFLTSMKDYVNQTSGDGSTLCVIDDKGRVLFSPMEEGTFKIKKAVDAIDLRQSDNTALAAFVTKAFTENTGLQLINVDETDYYMVGSPMSSIGWAVLNIVEKEVTHQPTAAMLA